MSPVLRRSPLIHHPPPEDLLLSMLLPFPNTCTEALLQGWFAWFRAELWDRKVVNITTSFVCVNLIENDKIRRNTEMRITASALSSNTRFHDNK